MTLLSTKFTDDVTSDECYFNTFFIRMNCLASHKLLSLERRAFHLIYIVHENKQSVRVRRTSAPQIKVHLRSIFTKLFENHRTGFGIDFFKNSFLLVAMEIRNVHGSNKFEGV